MFTAPHSTIEKGVNLSAQAAEAWLTERGFSLSGGEGSGRMAADAYRAPNFAIARLWLDSRSLLLSARESDGLRIIIITEGSVTVHCQNGEEYELERGDASISRMSIAERFISSAPIALIQISLEGDFSLRYALREIAGTVIARGSKTPVTVLAALVNSTLTSMNVMELSWGHIRTAVEANAAALITLERVDRSTASSGSRLLDSAILLIEENSADPLFTVASLVAALRVSERRLQEVFAASGSSPRAAIARRRLQQARGLIDSYPMVDKALFSEVARVSGFKSARALRDAIRADGVRRTKDA